jgi:hypothetical protein
MFLLLLVAVNSAATASALEAGVIDNDIPLIAPVNRGRPRRVLVMHEYDEKAIHAPL